MRETIFFSLLVLFFLSLSLGLNAISWRVTFLTSPLFLIVLSIDSNSIPILYEWAALYSSTSSFFSFKK